MAHYRGVTSGHCHFQHIDVLCDIFCKEKCEKSVATQLAWNLYFCMFLHFFESCNQKFFKICQNRFYRIPLFFVLKAVLYFKQNHANSHKCLIWTHLKSEIEYIHLQNLSPNLDQCQIRSLQITLQNNALELAEFTRLVSKLNNSS